MTTRSEVRRELYAQRQTEFRFRAERPEVREAEDGTLALRGYASVTDAPYEVEDWLGAYTETVERGAFGKALRDGNDVRLLVNHDGVPLARTRSGTLALREVTDPLADPQGRGQTGLWCEATLDGASPLAQTVRSAMARGDMDEMSFAFQATRQEWNEDYTQRTIREVKLFDVSVVTYPANPATSVQLNSEHLAGVAARMASKRSLTDPDDVAFIGRLLGVLSAIDSIADEAAESTADYLGVADPDADEPEPDEPAADDSRARALALAQARAHRA
jgi:HK97 family phage prohead protease